MQIRAMAAGLLAVGLLAAGCGGVDTTMEEPSNLATREDSLPPCDGGYYDHLVYTDATYTTVKGGWHCLCGDYNGWVFGSFSGAYYQDVELGVCY